YPAEVQQRAGSILKRLEADIQKQAARLAELEPLLARGDASRGREIFFGQKAACTICHSVQSRGGHVGPDLSKNVATRSGRGLLEAIVQPSASFARGFEPYWIGTDDGRIFSGISTRESSQAFTPVATDRTEVHLSRAAIESIARSRDSIMPPGL